MLVVTGELNPGTLALAVSALTTELRQPNGSELDNCENKRSLANALLRLKILPSHIENNIAQQYGSLGIHLFVCEPLLCMDVCVLFACVCTR